jgi:hypothetical protein
MIQCNVFEQFMCEVSLSDHAREGESLTNRNIFSN